MTASATIESSYVMDVLAELLAPTTEYLSGAQLLLQRCCGVLDRSVIAATPWPTVSDNRHCIQEHVSPVPSSMALAYEAVLAHPAHQRLSHLPADARETHHGRSKTTPNALLGMSRPGGLATIIDRSPIRDLIIVRALTPARRRLGTVPMSWRRKTTVLLKPGCFGCPEPLQTTGQRCLRSLVEGSCSERDSLSQVGIG